MYAEDGKRVKIHAFGCKPLYSCIFPTARPLLYEIHIINIYHSRLTHTCGAAAHAKGTINFTSASSIK